MQKQAAKIVVDGLEYTVRPPVLENIKGALASYKNTARPVESAVETIDYRTPVIHALAVIGEVGGKSKRVVEKVVELLTPLAES